MIISLHIYNRNQFKKKVSTKYKYITFQHLYAHHHKNNIKYHRNVKFSSFHFESQNVLIIQHERSGKLQKTVDGLLKLIEK